jgi:hypothetical protein
MKADSRDPHPFAKFNDAVRTFLKAPKAAVEAKERELHEKRSRARKKRAAAS